MKLATRRVTRSCCAVLLVGGCAVPRALAQSLTALPRVDLAAPAPVETPPEKSNLDVSHLFTGTFGGLRRLPAQDSLALLAIGAAFAATAHAYDASATARLAGSSPGRDAFVPGRIVGGAEFQFGAALATYGIGRLSGQTRVAEVGSHLLRAQLVAQGVTHAIKYSVRRMRPDGSTRNSFPSGHTSVSFASATVLHREFGWKVGVPAYAVASYIGLSRIEQERHYLSDIVFGAALGIVAGRAVTIGRGDARFHLTPVATRGGGGVSFAWAGHQ
jgi:membrane-associated phospholipid phosphatase